MNVCPLKYLALALLFLCIPAIHATPSCTIGAKISQFSLEDQHNVTHTVDEDVRLILFTKDKKSNKLVEEALVGVEKDYLPGRHAVCVSDISGMPKLISKIFAMPKMKKYPYEILLDRDRSVTRDFPSKENSVTLLYIKNLQITDIQFANSPETIKKAIESTSS